MTGLVTTKQLEALSKVAERGMITTVDIYRRDAADAPAPSDDYGDNVDYTQTSGSKYSRVKGWLRTVPTALVQELDNGAIVTVNTWELRVPVGTDVQTGDEVRVGGDQYTVSSTNRDNTLLPYISCNLRRRE
jgi:hypothetical protein